VTHLTGSVIPSATLAAVGTFCLATRVQAPVLPFRAPRSKVSWDDAVSTGGIGFYSAFVARKEELAAQAIGASTSRRQASVDFNQALSNMKGIVIGSGELR
jgi:hypothetical protein